MAAKQIKMAAEGFPVPPRDNQIKVLLSLLPLAVVNLSLVFAVTRSNPLIFATVATMWVSFMLMSYFGAAPDLPATPEEKKRLRIIFFVLNTSLFGSMAANSALTMPFVHAAVICALCFAFILFKCFCNFIYVSEEY